MLPLVASLCILIADKFGVMLNSISWSKKKERSEILRHSTLYLKIPSKCTQLVERGYNAEKAITVVYRN